MVSHHSVERSSVVAPSRTGTGGRLSLLAVFLLLLVGSLPGAPRRFVVNPSFEEPVIPANSYRFLDEAIVEGWETTDPTGVIEYWHVPFNGVTPYDGNQFAELNANNPSRLDPEIDACMLAGEAMRWRLAHRGRSGVDTARLLINGAGQADFSDGNSAASTHSCSDLLPGVGCFRVNTASDWGYYEGAYAPGYTTPTGVRLSFQAISSVGGLSYGNFLDAIQVLLAATIRFTPSGGGVNPSGLEEESTYDLSITLDGLLRSDAQVDILLGGSTTLEPDDYTLGTVTGPYGTPTATEVPPDRIRVTLPAGLYDPDLPGDRIVLPITFSDIQPEEDETLSMTLVDPGGGGGGDALLDLIAPAEDCDGPTDLNLSFQVDDDDDLTLDKTASPTSLGAGGSVTYRLEIGAGISPVTETDVADTLPPDFEYTTGTAVVAYPDGTTAQVDPALSGSPATGRLLTWDLTQTLQPGEQMVITFDASHQASCLPTSSTLGEDWESGTYTAGSTAWIESGDSGVGQDPGDGNVRIRSETTATLCDGNALEIRRGRTQSISRQFDLSDYCTPVLTYDVSLQSLFGSNESYSVEISTDGSNYTPLRSYPDAANCATETVDLSAYAGADPVFLRVVGDSGNDWADRIRIDDLLIQDTPLVLPPSARNSATTTGQINGTSQEASDVTSVWFSDLSLAKSVDLAQAGVGDELTYTLSWANQGSSTLSPVTLTDVVPPGTSFVPASATGGASYDSPSETLTWSLGSLAPGSSGTVSYRASVDPTLVDRTRIDNLATITDGSQPVTSDRARSEVRVPRLDVVKTAPGAVKPGGVVPYSLSVRNSGAVTASNVFTQDQVPAGTAFVVGSASAGATYSGDGGLSFVYGPSDSGDGTDPGVTHVRFDLGSLAGPASTTATFSVQVLGSTVTGSPIENRAFADSDETNFQVSNRTVTTVTDLVLRAASVPTVTCPRRRVDLAFEVENLSTASTYSTVAVTVPVPAYTDYLQGTVAAPVGWTTEFSRDGGTSFGSLDPTTQPAVTHLRFSAPSMAPGALATLGATVVVDQVVPSATPLEVLGQLRSDQQATYAPVLSNQLVLPVVNLRLTKTADRAAARPGDVITWTLTLENQGTEAATSVVLSDPASGFLLFDHVDPVLPIPDGGSFAGGVVSWPLGTLVPFGTPVVRSFQTTVKAATPEGTQLVNLAEATSQACSIPSEAEIVVVSDGAVAVGVDAEAYGDQGQTLCYPVTLTHTASSGADETIEVSTAVSDGAWAGSFTVYRDVDGDGSYDPGLDTVLGDTGGPPTPDSGPLAPGQSLRLVVCVTIPGSVGDNAVNDLTLTGAARSNPSDTASARLRTTVLSTTAVRLLGPRAQGEGDRVAVRWTTLTENANRGFQVERSSSASGPWSGIHCCLVPGRGDAVGPHAYEQWDDQAPALGPVWYRLAAVDTRGRVTHHGPVALDRDGDGLGFDQEEAHGLSDADPSDAGADPDGDGVPTGEELALGRDPFGLDSLGDGPRVEQVGSLPGPPGLRLVEEGAEARVYELVLAPAELVPELRGGERWHSPRLADVAYGWTERTGWPRLPVVGTFLPPGFEVVEVLASEVESLEEVTVGPVPEIREGEFGENLAPRYAPDPAFYQAPPPLWPEAVASVAPGSRLLLHPLRVDHAGRRLEAIRRLRVRVTRGSPLAPASPGSLAGASTALGSARLGLVASASATPGPGLTGIPAGSVYRLGLTGPGLHRLSGSDLEGLGVPVSGHDPRLVGLYRDGLPVPVRIRGEEDGRFDSGDLLEFYTERDGDRSVAGDALHLLLGSVPGTRWQTGSTHAGAPTTPFATWYLHRVEEELREVYYASLPGDPAEDRFVAAFTRQPTAPPGVSPARVDFSLEIHDPVPVVTGGRAEVTYGAAQDQVHRHALWLDGQKLGTNQWQGTGLHQAAAWVPGSLLTPGTHRLGLEVDPVSGVSWDQLLPTRVALEYPRSPSVRGDSVAYWTPTTDSGITFTGFSGPGVTVLDVTDPDQPVLVENHSVTGAGPSGVTLTHDPSGSRHLLLVGPGGARGRASVQVRPVPRGDLRDPGTRVGWLAVVPEGWETALDPLLALRRDQGLEPRVLSMQEVADEFGGGLVRPQAIEGLVHFARENWARAPEFLLLCSDTHMNPRSYPGLYATAAPVGVPTVLSLAGPEGYRAETGDDQAFVRDPVSARPLLAVGRLPARDRVELRAMADKIVAYEAAGASGAWTRRILSLADDGEPLFTELAEERVRDLLPGLQLTRLHQGDATTFANLAQYQSAVDSSLAQGSLLVQFVGHAFFNTWTSDAVLDQARAQGLANAPALPVVLSFSCYDNHFTNIPEFALEGLGETLVRNPVGGAVAFVGAGFQSSIVGKDQLHEALLQVLFQEQRWRIGEALRAAFDRLLATSSDPEGLTRGFLLMGDPATRMAIPNPLRPTDLVAEALASGEYQLTWTPGDPGGASGYRIWRRVGSGPLVLVGQSSGTRFLDGGGTGEGIRSYAVQAETSEGLASAVSLETQAAPLVVAPTVPTGGGGGGGGCRLAGPGEGGAGGLLLSFLAFLGLLGTRARGRDQ